MDKEAQEKIARELMNYDGLNDDFYFDNQVNHRSLITDYLWKASRVLALIPDKLPKADQKEHDEIVRGIREQALKDVGELLEKFIEYADGEDEQCLPYAFIPDAVMCKALLTDMKDGDIDIWLRQGKFPEVEEGK